MRLVFDSEGDGLLDTVSRIWCIVAMDIDTKNIVSFGPTAVEDGLQYLKQADALVGHNILDYDFGAFEKCYGWVYEGKTFDTLIASRTLWPDRPFPTNTINGEMYSPNMGGPHSIAAWGWRIGRKKPEHEDWSVYSQEMLHRCQEDTEINYATLVHLLTQEAKVKLDEVLG